jgi:plastocyanin
MNKLMGTVVAALPFVFPISTQAKSAAPFEMTSQIVRTISAEDLAKAETTRSLGVLSNDNLLTYSTPKIRLVVRTGPEDDMLSYRIQGMRNPTLVVPVDAVLDVLFVNTDEDMRHDLRFGAVKPPLPLVPDVADTVGSAKLSHEANEQYSAQELTLRAVATGSFTYFCSVRGHAKGGMFGTIAVGTAPGDTSTPAPSHEHHMTMPGMTHEGHSAMPGMDHGMKHGMTMRSSLNLNDPMSREGSGTSWLPDSSPIYARMRMKGDKMLMWHGSIFPRFTRIGGDRDVSAAGKGDRDRFDAPSMFMGMYSQPLGAKGQLGLRLMTSLDPIIERGYGYPLLYQSGESYHDAALHDRQHPHDFISELSATYSRRLGEHDSAYLYLGYPGEPALGPPVFMHRPSAMDNPDAPISHHWQDSTHITWGVATAGYSTGKWKVEASAFKGEEPDENRYNFDSPRLDSFSGRLSWNPTRDLALQISHGYLKHPEPLEPDVNLHRTTASVIYNKALGEDINWSNTLVWGQNNAGSEGRTNAYLFETNYQRHANTFYARFERAQKSGHELVLAPADEDRVFDVGSYALGYVRDLKRNNGWDVGLGGQITFNTNPSGLDSYYDGGSHTGFQIFLRIRPSRL